MSNIVPGGWYSTGDRPLAKSDGTECKRIKLGEIVVAKVTSRSGEDCFVQGLDSREYDWISVASLTRIDPKEAGLLAAT